MTNATGTCGQCQFEGNQEFAAASFAIIDRSVEQPAWNGVAGTAYVRSLCACTPIGNGQWDQPFVIPATLQRIGATGNVSRIVQAGYCRNGGGPLAWSGGIPDDGKEHFFYTKTDDEGGLVYHACDWYGKEPIEGHLYKFRIQAYTSATTGEDLWQYGIRDITAGETAYTTIAHRRTWTLGDYAWWGAENHNLASRLGRRWSADPLGIVGEYRDASSGLWYRAGYIPDNAWLLTGPVLEHGEAWYTANLGGHPESYYHYAQDHDTGALDVWTTEHGIWT